MLVHKPPFLQTKTQLDFQTLMTGMVSSNPGAVTSGVAALFF